MGTDLDVGFQRKFKDDFLMAYQQETSKLRDSVDTDFQEDGSVIYFDFIGKATVRERVRVGEPTQHNPPPTSRRLIRARVKKWDAYISQVEIRKMGRDPQNKWNKAAVAAHMRDLDRTIILAAYGNATTADENLAESTVALPSSQKIAVASSGLTIAKINTVTEGMDAAEVPQEERHAVIGPKEKSNLLNLIQATSSDYTAKRLWDNPMIDGLDWAGFRWRLSNELPTDSSNNRLCLFYQKMAIGLWVPKEVTTEAAIDPGHSFDVAMKVEMEKGATRVRDLGVFQVACKES